MRRCCIVAQRAILKLWSRREHIMWLKHGSFRTGRSYRRPETRPRSCISPTLENNVQRTISSIKWTRVSSTLSVPGRLRAYLIQDLDGPCRARRWEEERGSETKLDDAFAHSTVKTESREHTCISNIPCVACCVSSQDFKIA
jgi:hypothetical protein